MTQIRDVEDAVMGRAVVTHKSGAVHAENHGQVLQGHVMFNHVIGALQERAVDSRDRLLRPKPPAPAAKPTACCSAMAVSKITIRVDLAELGQAGSIRHSGGNRHHFSGPARPFSIRGVAEHICPRLPAGLAAAGRARCGVLETWAA